MSNFPLKTVKKVIWISDQDPLKSDLDKIKIRILNFVKK